MTSSGLWTPNRDLDLTLERGLIWDLLLDPISRGTDGVITLSGWSHTMNLVVHMRYTPTGNPRVHGVIHHTYTTPSVRRSQDGLRMVCHVDQMSDLRSSKVVLRGEVLNPPIWRGGVYT